MRILIIQQKMIGDVLTSSILFEALKSKYPDAVLHYMIYKHTFPVVKDHPHIDGFLFFEQRHKNWFQLFQLVRRIRKEQYDIVIDVYSKVGTALIAAFSGAPTRIAFKKWYTSLVNTRTFSYRTYPQSDKGLAIENRMLLLKGVEQNFPQDLKPRIYLTPQEKKRARQLLISSGVNLDHPLIMCGILGSSSQKSYPLKYMAQILKFIVDQTEAQLLLNYIPNQKNQVQELLSLCDGRTRSRIFFEVFGTDLRDFMALTYHCNALIGNEGGAVNMAKALGVPTFSIFSPQIKKANWAILEDGLRHVSVHLEEYHPEVLRGLKKKEIIKNSRRYYELLEPNLIFAQLGPFLARNRYQDNQNNSL